MTIIDRDYRGTTENPHHQPEEEVPNHHSAAISDERQDQLRSFVERLLASLYNKDDAEHNPSPLAAFFEAINQKDANGKDVFTTQEKLSMYSMGFDSLKQNAHQLTPEAYVQTTTALEEKRIELELSALAHQPPPIVRVGLSDAYPNGEGKTGGPLRVGRDKDGNPTMDTMLDGYYSSYDEICCMPLGKTSEPLTHGDEPQKYPSQHLGTDESLSYLTPNAGGKGPASDPSLGV